MRLTRSDAEATGDVTPMPLTRSFKETIHVRIENDPVFRDELLKVAVECIRSGDVETGKTVLRDYVNATIDIRTLDRF